MERYKSPRLTGLALFRTAEPHTGRIAESGNRERQITSLNRGASLIPDGTQGARDCSDRALVGCAFGTHSSLIWNLRVLCSQAMTTSPLQALLPVQPGSVPKKQRSAARSFTSSSAPDRPPDPSSLSDPAPKASPVGHPSEREPFSPRPYVVISYADSHPLFPVHFSFTAEGRGRP